jgi:predicted enzyme related to lactoylglutathione lyase
MARVTGIGGVFLRSSDPKALAKWYSENLGITLADFNGFAFPWSDEVPEGSGMTAWSAFPTDTSYFGDGPQQAMINYRVDDLDALLATLSAAGVWIDPKRDDQPYGSFAWIKDCDGNRLELWQPIA